VEFTKYHGAGNDFIIIDGIRQQVSLQSAQIQKWCSRHFGIGADGLIIIAPSEAHAYEMIYHNADGLVGSMCGNGARCAFHFAHSLGYAGDQSRFEAYDGVHTAGFTESGLIAVSMSNVSRIDRVGEGNTDYVLDTGSPHYVRFVSAIENVDVFEEGRSVRNSLPFIEKGINVNFAQPGKDFIRLRTYERGVEDVTLACGTGATATAIAFAEMTGLGIGPLKLVADGGILEVDFDHESDRYVNVVLNGEATPVFEGRLPD